MSAPVPAARLALHEALCTKPIAIPDEAIGTRKTWREIGELARNAGQPLHLKDVAEHFGTKDMSRTSHNIRRAVKAGLVRKIGYYGGWVAVD
jgi:hypothetical protein